MNIKQGKEHLRQEEKSHFHLQGKADGPADHLDPRNPIPGETSGKPEWPLRRKRRFHSRGRCAERPWVRQQGLWQNSGPQDVHLLHGPPLHICKASGYRRGRSVLRTSHCIPRSGLFDGLSLPDSHLLYRQEWHRLSKPKSCSCCLEKQ